MQTDAMVGEFSSTRTLSNYVREMTKKAKKEKKNQKWEVSARKTSIVILALRGNDK